MWHCAARPKRYSFESLCGVTLSQHVHQVPTLNLWNVILVVSESPKDLVCIVAKCCFSKIMTTSMIDIQIYFMEMFEMREINIRSSLYFKNRYSSDLYLNKPETYQECSFQQFVVPVTCIRHCVCISFAWCWFSLFIVLGCVVYCTRCTSSRVHAVYNILIKFVVFDWGMWHAWMLRSRIGPIFGP
jgi:hypothetical protein